MGEVFGKLVGITGWFVGFVCEVSRGIAVGRGYEPVGKNSRMVRHTPGVHRDAGSGLRMARKETRVRQRKKRNAGG